LHSSDKRRQRQQENNLNIVGEPVAVPNGTDIIKMKGSFSSSD